MGTRAELEAMYARGDRRIVYDVKMAGEGASWSKHCGRLAVTTDNPPMYKIVFDVEPLPAGCLQTEIQECSIPVDGYEYKNIMPYDVYTASRMQDSIQGMESLLTALTERLQHVTSAPAATPIQDQPSAGASTAAQPAAATNTDARDALTVDPSPQSVVAWRPHIEDRDPRFLLSAINMHYASDNDALRSLLKLMCSWVELAAGLEDTWANPPMMRIGEGLLTELKINLAWIRDGVTRTKIRAALEAEAEDPIAKAISKAKASAAAAAAQAANSGRRGGGGGGGGKKAGQSNSSQPQIPKSRFTPFRPNKK